MLLTTFKRDGAAVATPVWPFEVDGRLMASTGADAAKLKRIANNPTVLIATCTQRGKPTGPTYRARARTVDGEDRVRAMRAKHRRWRITRLIEAIDRSQQVPIEIHSQDD